MNSSRPDHRIANLVQLARNFLVLDFKIGNRRPAPRTPVHDVLAAINQPFFIQPDENLAHRARKILVHGEVFAVPVHRRAQPLHLVENGAAVMLLPLPHPLDEFFASQIAALLAFAGQLALDHHLRGDAGMVGARQPQREKSPRMRCQRMMMSICVWLSMCPMCSRPVTFGGGSSRVNTWADVSPSGRRGGREKSFSLTQYSAQRVSIAPGSYALGRSWGILSACPVVWGRSLFRPCRGDLGELSGAGVTLILREGGNGGQTRRGVRT